jgi:hypothetical protein
MRTCSTYGIRTWNPDEYEMQRKLKHHSGLPMWQSREHGGRSHANLSVAGQRPRGGTESGVRRASRSSAQSDQLTEAIALRTPSIQS